MNLDPLSWPVAAKIAALAVLAAGAGTGAALVANSGQGQASPAAGIAASATPLSAPVGSPDTSGDCLFGANGADVQVGIAAPTQSCGQWIQGLAGDGLVWYPISQMTVPGSQGSADGDTVAEVCDLTDGTQEMYVQDGGSAFYGNDICNQEEQDGWTPEGTPGPLASDAQQVERQQEQAQASASAAAQAQQAQENLSRDDQSMGNDVASLNQDLSTWSSDVATAQKDYQALLTEPVCNSDGSSNQNTYDDAQNVYDDGQNVYDDEGSLSNDISTVQNDISTVSSDLADVGTSSIYANDITAARTAVSKAQAAVNADSSSKIQSEAEAVQTKVDGCTG